MSLKPVSYISLSALSYIEFNSLMRNKTVEYLVNNKLIKEDNLSNPELSALKSSSNPLRSYILLDYTSTLSGFRGAAFQNPKTGEIIFSFKGTDFDPSNPKTLKHIRIPLKTSLTLMDKFLLDHRTMLMKMVL